MMGAQVNKTFTKVSSIAFLDVETSTEKDPKGKKVIFGFIID